MPPAIHAADGDGPRVVVSMDERFISLQVAHSADEVGMGTNSLI